MLEGISEGVVLAGGVADAAGRRAQLRGAPARRRLGAAPVLRAGRAAGQLRRRAGGRGCHHTFVHHSMVRYIPGCTI